MTRITVAHGGSRDANFPVSVNGEIIVIQAGVEQDVPATHIEALQHTYGISYSAIASGDFTATSVIDPVNGAYTFNGVTVALADIIDVTTPSFNPANDMDAGGIKLNTDDGDFGGRSMPFIGDLFDSLVNGFTIVFEVYTGQVFSVGIELNDPVASYTATNTYAADNINGQFTRNLTALDQTSVDYFTSTSNLPGDNVTQVAADSIVKVAMTIATDRVSQSVAGESAVSIAHGGSAATADFISFDMGGGSFDTTPRIRKFSVYAPVADADLPTLSAA
jgi:hypothetical protein